MSRGITDQLGKSLETRPFAVQRPATLQDRHRNPVRSQAYRREATRNCPTYTRFWIESDPFLNVRGWHFSDLTLRRTSAWRQKRPLAREYAHLPMRIVIEGTACVLRTRVGNPGMIATARRVESWRPNISSRFFPSEDQVYRSWQILPLRTFRSGWRAECSARATVPSFSGRRRAAKCPNVRWPCRRRPSCRCRRRRSPYHSGRR